MGHNLWLHFGVDEHPFATHFDVHHNYRVLTHNHVGHGKSQLGGGRHACDKDHVDILARAQVSHAPRFGCRT